MDGIQENYNTGHVDHSIRPGDRVVGDDPNLTEAGTLFLLSALGVQGVPKPGENGKPDVAES